MPREKIKEIEADRESSNVMAVYNSSGSGKTRLLLESLCESWGIYLTTSTELNRGSDDLTVMSALLHTELQPLDQVLPATELETQNNHNHDTLNRHMGAIVLGRLMLLEKIIEAGSGSSSLTWLCALLIVGRNTAVQAPVAAVPAHVKRDMWIRRVRKHRETLEPFEQCGAHRKD